MWLQARNQLMSSPADRPPKALVNCIPHPFSSSPPQLSSSPPQSSSSPPKPSSSHTTVPAPATTPLSPLPTLPLASPLPAPLLHVPLLPVPLLPAPRPPSHLGSRWVPESPDHRKESDCLNDEYVDRDPEDTEEILFNYSEELFQCLMCDSDQVFLPPMLVKHMEANHREYFRCPHCYGEFPEDERLLKLHI